MTGPQDKFTKSFGEIVSDLNGKILIFSWIFINLPSFKIHFQSHSNCGYSWAQCGISIQAHCGVSARVIVCLPPQTYQFFVVRTPKFFSLLIQSIRCTIAEQLLLCAIAGWSLCVPIRLHRVSISHRLLHASSPVPSLVPGNHCSIVYSGINSLSATHR